MELYEAADVDGANGFVKFIKITMPYMLFVTAPYLITTFTANINNFNIVYLLTKGDPVMAGATAGKTDLLVTWLYKMTIDYQYYNLGAVIGISDSVGKSSFLDTPHKLQGSEGCLYKLLLPKAVFT